MLRSGVPYLSSSRSVRGASLALALLVVADARAQDATARPRAAPDEPSPARFIADPITDGAIISLSLGFGALSELVLTTGEIVPQQPQRSSRLLAIDRLALTKHEASAGPTSSYGALVALLYAVADPIASGYRDGSRAGLVDAVLYAEALALTWAATNMAKLTVRRPRPRAYQEQERLYELYGEEDAPSITETDTGLSFFSGHTALAAAVTGTATYLAFARSPRSVRPWITLIVGTALTAFVGIQRVRAGAHFPTDVISAAMAGTGIGLLVPHLHRDDTIDEPALWIGWSSEGDGGTLSVSGAL
jgi:undecaprenyl-diphosphatase